MIAACDECKQDDHLTQMPDGRWLCPPCQHRAAEADGDDTDRLRKLMEEKGLLISFPGVGSERFDFRENAVKALAEVMAVLGAQLHECRSHDEIAEMMTAQTIALRALGAWQTSRFEGDAHTAVVMAARVHGEEILGNIISKTDAGMRQSVAGERGIEVEDLSNSHLRPDPNKEMN